MESAASYNGGLNTLSGDSYDNTRSWMASIGAHVKFVDSSPRTERTAMAADERRVQTLCPRRTALKSARRSAIIRTGVRHRRHFSRTLAMGAATASGVSVRVITSTRYPTLRRMPRSVTTAAQGGMEPPARKLRDKSIQFGTIRELRERAPHAGWKQTARGGETGRISTAPTRRCSAG